ncbi:MAG: DMT family transporter [Acidimicrobiia bacterium]
MKRIIKSGYFNAFMVAALASGYVLTTRAAYLKTKFEPSSYVPIYLLTAGLCGFIEIAISKSYSRNFDGENIKSVITKSKGLILNGLLATISFALLAVGQRHTSAANASVIMGSNFVPTAIFSWILLKRKLIPKQLVFMLMTIFGLYIAVVGFNSLKLVAGDLIILGAATVIGFTNSYMKLLTKNFSSSFIANTRLTVGLACCIIFLLIFRPEMNVDIKDYIYPIFAGICFWYSVKMVVAAVEKLHANEAIIIAQLHIVITPIVAYLTLNESYRIETFIGSLVMIFGVFFFAFWGRENKAKSTL